MKAFRLLLFSLFVFLLSPTLTHAEAFDITNFHTDMQINEDGILNVTEKIDVFFSEERHGIFRDIDTQGIAIHVTDVSDDKGGSWQYDTSYFSQGLRLKIGDANKYVTKDQNYNISYNVSKGIRFFKTHDELYWNVTGNGWETKIHEASATVMLPPHLKRHELDFRCYTGSLYSTDENCIITYYPLSNAVAFKTSDKLSAYEGLTIVVSMPAGTIQKPATLEIKSEPTDATVYLNDEKICPTNCTRDDLPPGKYELTIKKFGYKSPEPEKLTLLEGDISYHSFQLSHTAWFLLLKFLLLLLGIFIIIEPFYTFLKKGKDPTGRGTIIPYYEAPEGLSPAEAGTLLDERADLRDISATIIDLCVHGYLAIKVLPDAKGFIFKTDDYELIKKEVPKAGARPLTPFEKDLMKDIFGSAKTKKVSALKNKFYKKLPSLKKSLYQSLVEKGFFPASPTTVRTHYLIKACIAFFIGFLLLGLEAAFFESIFSASLLINGFLTIIFAPFMPKKTKEGRLTYEQILGFKDYLITAEKHRLQFQEKEHLFYEFLPYAMTMQIADKWSNAFKGMFNKPPDWYQGVGKGPFSPTAFVSNLNTVTTNLNQTFISQPGGSGGRSGFSSSGFSGGFSGGGFGGGGGGSW